MKPLLLVTGTVAAILIVFQLVMGLLLLEGQTRWKTAHQHSGYTTVVVTLVYIGWSMAVILSSRRQSGS